MPKQQKRKNPLHHFYFHNSDEFVIFMVWGLFVIVLFSNIIS
jgi:hypothetical protein